VKVEEGDRCVKGTHVHAGVERESQAVETIQKHSRTSFAQRWPERTRWHTMVGTPMCGVLTGQRRNDVMEEKMGANYFDFLADPFPLSPLMLQQQTRYAARLATSEMNEKGFKQQRSGVVPPPARVWE
jgi:hypothetical protein